MLKATLNNANILFIDNYFFTIGDGITNATKCMTERTRKKKCKRTCL